jgi:hypothetical protein
VKQQHSAFSCICFHHLFLFQILKTYFFPYLRLLLEALGKFPPPPSSKSLFRGVREALLELEPWTYFSGGNFVWLAISSLTDSIDTLSNPQFLGRNGKRTMFHISTRNAVNIKGFSAIPSECEWVLLPGMPLTITGVSTELGEDLTVVSVDVLLPFFATHYPQIYFLSRLLMLPPLLHNSSTKFSSHLLFRMFFVTLPPPSPRPFPCR